MEWKAFMKWNFLASYKIKFCLVSLIFVNPLFLIAASEKTLESRSKNSDQLTIKPSGIAKGAFHFLDSSRKNTPDFGFQKVWIGIDSAYQRFGGGVQIGYNFHDIELGSNSNGIIVRKADLYADLISKTDSQNFGYNLRANMGRYQPKGADGIGPDIASTPDGYDFMDGIFLENEIGLGKTTLGVDLGVANNMAFYDYTQTNVSNAAFLGTTSISKSLAYYAGLMITTQLEGEAEFRFRTFYAGSSRQPIQRVINGAYPGSQQVQAAADLTHIESSLAYQNSSWGGNVWFELNKATGLKVPDSGQGSPLGGNYVYINPDSSQLAAANDTPLFNGGTYVYGITAKGNSSSFLHSMLVPEDALTLAGAVAFKQISTNSLSRLNVNYYELSLGIGYTTKNNNFFIELNGQYNTICQVLGDKLA